MYNIGFLIMDLSHGGGTERATIMVANGLSNAGWKVHIISVNRFEKAAFELESNVITSYLDDSNSSSLIVRRIKRESDLKKYVKKNNIRIMVAVDVALFLYLLPLKIEGICRCISWEHFNCFISFSKLMSLGRLLSVKFADRVVVLGDCDLEAYKEKYGNYKKIVRIYNPLSMPVVTSKDFKHKCSFRVLAVGRLTSQKGFDLLIDSWNVVEHSSKFDNRWHLEIYGDGEDRDLLDKQITREGLKNIRLCGYSSNIQSEFDKSDIFVLSSRYEGFVLVLMEAQARGLPVVSFNCKFGPSELIKDNINGFIVNDYKDMANKLLCLMNDNKMRISFSEHSSDDLKRFNVKKIVEQWDIMLKELIS